MTMKWEPSLYKNPMARARGLGSAHHGLSHWLAQRVTAIANIPLVFWGVWSVLRLSQSGFADFQSWIAHVPNPILLSLFILSTFYHAMLGLQVVIEDYVHAEGCKVALLIALKLGLFALGFTALFCILKLSL